VPYAKPTNRFEHSELIGNFGGEINGQHVSATCFQAYYPPDLISKYIEKNMMSEDCLTLDIYRPANLGDRKPGILIWIHGGGFVM